MMDAYQVLRTAYDEQTKTLCDRQTEITKEITEIEAVDPETIEARKRVLARHIDDALAEGKKGFAEIKQAELEKVVSEQERQREKLAALREEAAGIKERLGAIAQKVFNEMFPTIQDESIDQWAAAAEQADEKWDGMERFARERKIHISVFLHKQGLVPHGHGETRHLRERLRHWVE